jgi:tRNA A-37 threonylcarbamoyl transferase component Bud32
LQTSSSPESEVPPLTRRVLDSLPQQPIHVARNWSKADVFLIEWPPHSGVSVVAKDMKRRAWWFRALAGRLFLRREWKVLRALDGMNGVPRAIARPDADSIVLQQMPGVPLKDMKRRDFPAAAMEKIEALINALHERGVTHGDLHAKNVLVDDAANVALIDWATATIWGNGRNAARQRLFREWRALDRRAVAKMKLGYARPQLSTQELAMLEGDGSTVLSRD